MLKTRAMLKVDLGRAVIVNGLVRFINIGDPHPDYDASPGHPHRGGRVSFDPELGGGPVVIQNTRPRFTCGSSLEFDWSKVSR